LHRNIQQTKGEVVIGGDCGHAGDAGVDFDGEFD